MLSKAMEQHVCRDYREWEELVDVVVFQKNRLEEKWIQPHSASHRIYSEDPWWLA